MSRAARLAELLGSADRVVALTGAGISVPSGIPDFRSPGTGLWANVDPMEVAHIAVFRREPERFWQFYGRRFATLRDKRPNGAHLALAELERRGVVEAVVTQNIDGLHRLAGTRDVIEVHGSIATSSCLDCRLTFELADVRARHAAAADGVPRCACGAALKPDVVLLDPAMIDGVWVAQQLATAMAAPKIIALAVPRTEEELLVLVEAGVLGYVTREQSVDDVVAAIRSVVREEVVCSPKMHTLVVKRLRALAAEFAPPVHPRLTAREHEILELIAQGLSNKEIASALRIERSTVKNHVHNILDKLQVQTRIAAVEEMRRGASPRFTPAYDVTAVAVSR